MHPLIKLAYARRAVVAGVCVALAFAATLMILGRSHAHQAELLAVDHSPAVILNGRVTALPAGDGLGLGSGDLTLAGPVNIGASSSVRLLDINGNGNQIALQNSVNNAKLEIISNSGGLIWDIDPLPATASDNQTIRMFRHTTTSGVKDLSLVGTSGQWDIRPDAVSNSRFGLSMNMLSIANSGLAILESLTAQTHGYTGVNVQGSGNTFNTTAGALSNFGGYFDGSGVRSTGANKLITVGVSGQSRDSQLSYGGYFVAGNSADGLESYGVYSTSPSGSLGLSGYFDLGNFQVNGHYTSFTTTPPTLNSGCTSGTGSSITGTDTDFKVVTGSTSTSCTVSFHASYGTAPTCTVFPESGVTLPTCTIGAAAITCTVNVTGTYNWHCGGTGIATPTAPTSPTPGG